MWLYNLPYIIILIRTNFGISFQLKPSTVPEARDIVI